MGSRLKTLLGALRHRFVLGGIALVIGLAGTAVYLKVLHKVYPVDSWLFWNLGLLWGWMLVFSVACVCMGQLILERLRLELPPLEAAVQSMTVGVVAFVMCMYGAGAIGLFDPIFAVLLPTLFTVAGARPALRLLARFRAEREDARPLRPFAWVVSAAGVGCVGLVYLQLLTPDAINYDASWVHLVIPQDYARAGRIVPFLGNYNMGMPHLHGLIHTWGWTVPGLDQPALRWMMALHNEFLLFLWTLAGLLAGVRRLVSEPRLRAAWAAFFLSPMIFVYDSNIGGAADHFAAFFVVPILLATLDLWTTFTPQRAALLAITAAGGLLTKYQVAYVLLPIGFLLGVRWLILAIRLRRGRPLAGDASIGWRELRRVPLVLVALGTLLVLPHFVKNAIFYNNPFYPLAMDLFSGSYPSVPGGDTLIRYVFTDDNWRPKGTTLERIFHAIKLFFTFSFEPHYSFTNNVPNIGSLFTLLLPLLLVIRDGRRIFLAAFVASGAIFAWALTYNVDRNLQIFMPVLMCVTAALIIRGWQLGWLARAGLIPLVALQIVWGGDALFYSGHDRLESTVALLKSGFEGRAKKRLSSYRSTFLALKKAIPENARVLLHTSHLSLGIDREIIQDWGAFQGYISYDGIRSVREVFDYYRARGITHILYESGVRSAPSKQEEIVFFGLISRHAVAIGNFGQFRLLKMPDAPPPPEAPYSVASFGMGPYQDGLYPIETLNTHEYLPVHVRRYRAPKQRMPARPEERAALVDDVDAVLVSAHAHLDAATESVLKRKFTMVARYGGYFTVYLRGGNRGR